MPLVSTTSSIVSSLKTTGVFPLVVDEFQPQGVLTVVWGPETEAKIGNLLPVPDVNPEPKFHVVFSEDQDPEATYTLCCSDPDAPSATDDTDAEFCHMLLSHIKIANPVGGVPHEIKSSEATVIASYLGPGPPAGTGKHRYVFVLFREPKTGAESIKWPIEDVESAHSKRACWGTGVSGSGPKEFAEKHNLTPVAVNFFYAAGPDA